MALRDVQRSDNNQYQIECGNCQRTNQVSGYGFKFCEKCGQTICFIDGMQLTLKNGSKFLRMLR